MRVLLVMVTALLVAPVASSVSLPNPCSLLTRAQVTVALGYRVADQTRGGTGRAPSCKWEGPAMGYSQSRPNIFLFLNRESEGQFKQAALNGLPITGLGAGADAYLMSQPQLVSVWKNGVEITVTFAQTTDTQRVAIRLAQQLVEHL
jgi:hypothetical protein